MLRLGVLTEVVRSIFGLFRCFASYTPPIFESMRINLVQNSDSLRSAFFQSESSVK